jgi:hypothetical protein
VNTDNFNSANIPGANNQEHLLRGQIPSAAFDRAHAMAIDSGAPTFYNQSN